MNILASYKWLKEYVKTDLSAEVFARELSLKSMSVESITHAHDKFANMVVGVIKEVKTHPKADRLRIAVTDVGSGIVEIVCGGSNLAVDQKVFVALPGSKVRWHGEGELVELAETEIRGVKSVGMICAPAEVGFEKLQGGEHEIWDLTRLTTAKAGTPIEQALDIDDAIFDIEITTNRPDCMGMLGLAREAAAAVEVDFVPPVVPMPSAGAGLAVEIEAQELCPRYMAATLTNVKIGPSPWWLQKKLLLAGHRPINNIVDITNFVLHEYGQPLHAFDASHVKDKIVVRLAQDGEVLKALDGKDYRLTNKHLVIADAHRPLAVAGVMGGLESGTTEATTAIIFEAATFEAVSIRRTARDLNLYSDSQLVFEKGLSTEALPPALARAIQLAQELAGAQLTGLTDVRAGEYRAEEYPVVFAKIRNRIGINIADDDISSILTRLGFTLNTSGTQVMASVPYWREHDLEAEVDLTEEVARMYGYHNLPLTLPSAPPPAQADDTTLVWERWLKRFLASVGYTEFFGYSFIDAKSLEKYASSPLEAVQVLNPLAEDLSHLRPSLMPSLLRDLERNQAHSPQGKVFELSRVHLLKAGDLPEERFRLVVADYGWDSAEQAYMDLRGLLELLGERTGVSFQIGGKVEDTRWHPSRSALVAMGEGDERKLVGTIGQVADIHQQAFGILKPVFAIDLDLEALMPHLRQVLSYLPVSEFPVVTRDLSFIVSERTEFAALAQKINAQDTLIQNVGLVDIYRGQGVEEGKKSVTLSLTFGSSERTLTSDEVENVMAIVKQMLVGEFAASLRS
jgi:phenylalanyl-tRNA synthetase beta chain